MRAVPAAMGMFLDDPRKRQDDRGVELAAGARDHMPDRVRGGGAPAAHQASATAMILASTLIAVPAMPAGYPRPSKRS